MKRIMGIMWLMVFAVAATSQEEPKHSATVVKDSKDTTEYEVVIIDPQFDQWYLANFTPAKDYSDAYYRSKILVSVPIWNEYYTKGYYRSIINNYIDYQPSVEYGIQVDRKIFWYFRYIQENYGVRLIY
jgi:hypothetical protein